MADLLTTTRAVRKRLDLTRPVEPEVMAGQVGASSELDRIYGKARRKLFRRS